MTGTASAGAEFDPDNPPVPEGGWARDWSRLFREPMGRAGETMRAKLGAGRAPFNAVGAAVALRRLGMGINDAALAANALEAGEEVSLTLPHVPDRRSAVAQLSDHGVRLTWLDQAGHQTGASS